MFDEVEQTFAAPVDVLENEDQRLSLGECFEETSPGGECLATIARRIAARPGRISRRARLDR